MITISVHFFAGCRARLVAVALAVGACQPSPDPPATGQAGELETTRASPPGAADLTPAGPDTLSGNRTPGTDPWLFEGIPNFEDLVAGRDGDWVVVLGSSTRSGAAAAATLMAASDPGLAAVQQRAWNAGRVPFVVASEELPALEPGLTVVVLGPFARAQAEGQLAALSGVIPDAFLREGW